MPIPAFTPRDYFNASREHLGVALRLREQGEHFAAHYHAGIAIEEKLRALSTQEDESFDGTHDLQHYNGPICQDTDELFFKLGSSPSFGAV